MAVITDFENAAEINATKAFETRFAQLKARHLNEEPLPTQKEDTHLLELFQAAYPISSSYLESLFDEPLQMAKDFELPAPQIPDTDILDPTREPFSGMGHSFFLRLIYLDTLANKARTEIEENISIPQAKILPDLQLLTASNLFHALKNETLKLLNQKIDEKSLRTEGTLPSWLIKTYQGSAGNTLQAGFITDISSTSLVAGGVRTLLTVALQRPGKIRAKLANISIDGPDRDHVKIGDFIGLSGIQKFNGRGNFMTADHAAILVPAKFISFLRSAEPDFTHLFQTDRELIPLTTDPNDPDYIYDPNDPDFKKGEALSDDYYGTIIFGRVLDWDERNRTITIKDKDNKTAILRTKELVQSFKLEKNTIFLTTPIQLGDDGIYTITTRNTEKLEAPYAGRLLSGLRSMSPHNKALTASEDFQATEPMLT